MPLAALAPLAIGALASGGAAALGAGAVGASLAGGVGSLAASSLMGNKGGSGGSLTGPIAGAQSTSTTGLPAYLQPYVNQGLTGAQDVYNKGYNVAPLSANQQQAATIASNYGPNNFAQLKGDQNFLQDQFLNNGYSNSTPGNGTYNSFANGSQVNNNPAFNDLSTAASGGYINNNPYTKQTADNANYALTQQFQNAISPGIDSSFENAGRYGSGLYANAKQQAQNSLAIGLGQTDANIYNNAYNTGVGAQLSAAGTVGGLYGQAQSQQLAGAQGLGTNYNNTATQQQNAANNARLLNSQVGTDTSNQIANLMSTGAGQQAYGQAVNNAPLTNTQNYLNNLMAARGNASTTVSTGPSSPSLLNQLGSAAGNYFGGNGMSLSNLFSNSGGAATPAFSTASGTGSGLSFDPSQFANF